MSELTQRQLEVLAFVASHIRWHGVPPTIRELCGAFCWRSTNAASDMLRALEAKGCIERWANKARTLQLTARGEREALQATRKPPNCDERRPDVPGEGSVGLRVKERQGAAQLSRPEGGGLWGAGAKESQGEP